MKTKFFKRPWPVFGQWPRGRRLCAAVLGAATLLAASSAMAAANVTTLTGGWWQFNTTTFYGNQNGNTFAVAQFNYPSGLALDPAGTSLFVADYMNNAVRLITDLGDDIASQTLTFADTSDGISRPVAVAVDGATNLYVLNRGNGNNGTVIEFDGVSGLPIATNAVNLTNATAMALDGLANLYVTIKSNTVIQITPVGAIGVVGVITNAGTSLRGITVSDSGLLALTDAGNNGIWMLNPLNGVASRLTGFHGAGDINGPPAIAALNRPEMIAKAGGNMLVVADRGNHKVKLVNASSGTVTRLYGVSSSLWVPGPSTLQNPIFPGWWDGDVWPIETDPGSVEAREPLGVVVAQDGSVYTTEVYYHIIRHITGTGLTAPQPGSLPLFNGPMGIALDSTGNFLFIADQLNNAVFKLNFGDNSTSPFATTNMSQPVAVTLDSADNLYVLNRGNGNNGFVLKFNKFGNFLGTNATALINATAIALDGSTNILVTELGGAIKRIPPGGGPGTVIVTVTNAGVQLQGIVVEDDGTLAVSDSGNHAVLLINPVSFAVSVLTGNNGPGNTIGTAPFAQLNQPHHLAKAGGGFLVVADFSNNRVSLVDNAGTATSLASTNSKVWFGRAGDPVLPASPQFVAMQQPAGIIVAPNGDVITAELLYHNVRRILNTGLTGPGGGSGGTNVVVITPPTISPNTGYYPMGQIITVGSPNPNVFYTTDGSQPTTNSARVTIIGNTGFIRWFNTTNDLRVLRLRAFVGTNASATVSGQPVSTNSIGVPPDIHATLYAGIGSTIVVPVVANLRPGDQIKSYQFLVTVTPDGGAPMIPPQLAALSISPSDFFPVAAPSAGTTPALISFQAYSNGLSRGLVVFTTGTNANVQFQNFATVALLSIPIPGNAVEGQTYSIAVTNASATSDGLSSPITLTPMLRATIFVTNVTYTVGDSASPRGGWYNAGSFGNRDIDNSDVNSVLYASLGMRVPFTFSDVYDSMDAWPQDVGPGVAIRDGLIGFQDWQVILQRSLRIPPFTNNWIRAWATNGDVTNAPTALISGGEPDLGSDWLVLSPWYRQALISASPVGNAIPGSTVDVPVFAKLVNGVTVAGLQFRAIVTPDGGSPALTEAVDFMPAAGITNTIKASLDPNQIGCGWPLIPSATFNFSSLSSNWLGNVRFRIPPNAFSGHSYTLRFANVDGAPDLNTFYQFESRRTTITVGTPALPVDLCSDDWKTHFFGSITNPLAAANVDADIDGSPNWQEFLAGTDPWNVDSCMHFHNASQTIAGGQKAVVFQWLTAPGRLYEVQSSSNPAGGWTPVITVSGNGDVAGCVETNLTQAVKFYRLKLIQ